MSIPDHGSHVRKDYTHALFWHGWRGIGVTDESGGKAASHGAVSRSVECTQGFDLEKTELNQAPCCFAPSFRQERSADDKTRTGYSETRATDRSDSEALTAGSWMGSTLALPQGYTLHEYRIDNVLGQGGFGITYLATDVHLNAKVAVKEYLPEYFACRNSDKTVAPRRSEDREVYQQGLDSFLVEARTLATFRHPNIVRVARFFESNETAYMVLEYERGLSLREWWKQQTVPLPEQDLLALLNPLLEGLMLVHSAGFLHRDIKPDNIYVRNEDGSLVLLDFGAARQTSSGEERGDCVVTPGYAPCEQYGEGEQGPWTDIYALGATLYWMVAGVKPPPAPDRRDEKEIMLSALELGEGRYSRQFLSAIDWALQTEAVNRPQNIGEFRKVLFGAHAASLGLQEALAKGDTDDGTGLFSAFRSANAFKGFFLPGLRAILHPSSWPIAFKMSVAMVMTALLPMIITAYYNLNGSIQSIAQGEVRDLELLAQSNAGRISQLISDSRNLAQYVATEEDFQRFLSKPSEAGRKNLQKKLDALIKSNPDALLMFVMDTSGNAVIATDSSVIGNNYQFREYYKSAMQGRPFVSGISIGKTTGKAGIYYANPIFNTHDTVVGVVVLRLKADSFADILNEVREGSSSYIPFLVDGDGVVIYHPDPKWLYSSIDRLPDEVMRRIVADQRFGRKEIPSLAMPDLARALVGAKVPGNIVYSVTGSARSIVGYAPVRGHDWVVAVQESEESFKEPLNKIFYNVLYSVILVGLLFFIIALLFARTIVRPIEELKNAVHALKKGDYDKAHITVTRNDELGKLARTFNVMIDVLRQRERERQRQAHRSVQSARKER